MTEGYQKIKQAIGEYGKGLFNFIRGRVGSEADAEDILQDVWCQLSNIDEVDDIEHLRAWLFKVARNRIIDISRKKSEELIDDLVTTEDDEEINFAEILMIDDDSPESVYLKDLFWDELFSALNELPENQRQVFVWNELEDKTLQQIADETGENLKTIISRKGYAVKHLRKRLYTLYNEFFD